MSEFHPAAAAGRYPQRHDRHKAWLAQAASKLHGAATRYRGHSMRGAVAAAERIVHRSDAYRSDDTALLRARARATGERLRVRGLHGDGIEDIFAIVRELADRTLSLRHYATQVRGGLALLRGAIAEMPTGEGKTLTATLPAATVALTGVPVHVITVNDYLARRDAEWMTPLYTQLGLTVGVVTAASTLAQRRAAYACDVTYCTSNQVVFDYLRDGLALRGLGTDIRLQVDWLRGRHARCGQLLMRGLGFAIVDEVDSVFVDEARTPLIISGAGTLDRMEAAVEQALALAARMEENRHYELARRERRVDLLEHGCSWLEEAAREQGRIWRVALYREELVRQALAALHLYRRDEHYIVRDGAIGIIDEHTGRVLPGRSWMRGLHQMIEAKEACAITPQRETLAQISYQRFFPRYLLLAGMTGTASEVRAELWQVYGTPVVSIPSATPCCRRQFPDRVFVSAEQKWRFLVERVVALHREGRPVLIGARTVTASEQVSERLRDAGIEHRVLNARQDADEAGLIALAGQRGAVTVATNMAGRGTDIQLGDGVVELGGLHVIVTERHEAARIDRQLIGRCARQGDPGSAEFILSLEDPLLEREHGGALDFARKQCQRVPWLAGERLRGRLLARAQRRVQALHSRMRRDLLRQDQQQSRQLAFTGAGE